jgi:hypothetical protein
MKRFSLISLSIISLVIILAHYAQASIHFQQFNINDYSKEQLPREELVKEIQTFVVRTLPKIENCNERGEGEFQSIFCTNIYEADRIRLAYILGYNANLKPEAITKTNHVRKLIFPANAKIYNENRSLKEENGDGNVYDNDSDGGIPNPHKVKKQPYHDNIDGNFKFGMATEIGLRDCAIDNSGQSQTRLKALNPQLETTDTNTQDKTSNNAKKTKQKPPEYPLIGCQDIKLVLKQFLSQNYINHILDNSPHISWLNFSQSEKINMQLSQKEIDNANGAILSDGEYQDIKSRCAVTGLQALLICPAMRTTGGLTQAGLNIIQKSMVLNPKFTNSRTKGGFVLYSSWVEFRNISNLILIIAFMIMIAAYVTNRQLDVYNLRKMLPKFIVIAILINASFLIMQVAVDISNIVGVGMFSLLSNIMPFNYDVMKTVSTVLAGGLIIGSVALAPLIGIAVLIPVILCAMLSVVIMVVMLALRDSAFIVLLVLTPVALISLLFPNSDRFYQVWKKSIWTILIIPPMIGLTFGSGKFLSGLMFQVGGLLQIFYIVPLALQFYLLPKILLNSIKNLPLIGNQIASTLDKIPDGVTDKYRSSEFHKQATINFRAKRSRSIKRAKFDKKHPLANSAYLAANKLNQGKNKVVDKFLSGYDTLMQAPAFDREAFEELVKNSYKMDPNVAQYYLKENDIMDKGLLNQYQKGLNSLSTEASTQLQTMLRNNNPDQILSSILKVSDDGEGNAQAILKGFNQYLERGGDYANLSVIAKNVEDNYKKEGKFTDAAFLKKIRDDAKKNKERIDYSEQLDVLQKMKPADQINLTSEYFNSVSDWKKFKGFKAGDVQDAAFRKFMATPAGQAQLDKIRAQSAQNTNAANYLSQF